MALIKNAHKSSREVAIIEDPRSTSNTVYFYGEAYTKGSYNPIFDKSLALTGTDRVSSWGMQTAGNSDQMAGHPGMTVITGKQNIGIAQSTNTNGEARINVDCTPLLSMDENNIANHCKLFQSGSDKMIVFSGHNYYGEADQTYYGDVGTTELYDLSVDGYWTKDYENNNDEGGGFRPICPIYLDGNGYIVGYAQRHIGDSYGAWSWGPHSSLYRVTGFPNYTAITYMGGFDNAYIMQHIGMSTVDNKGLWLYNQEPNDYTQSIVKYNSENNNETELFATTSIPSGGARNQTDGFGIGKQAMFSSKTFVDHSGNTAWYTPYFDTSHNYVPLYFQWDKTDDTFTRSECSISGQQSNAHIMSVDGQFSDQRGGWQAVMYNEHFTYNGDKYVTLFPMNAQYASNDSAESKRRFVTYSVSSANNMALTHHSSVTVPSTIKNVLFLNDARTRLAVVEHDSVNFYKFTSSGWSYTGNYTQKVHGLGVGLDGTLYAAVADNSDGYVSVHTISSDIPLQVVITAESNTYNYSGSNINTYVNIDAYDFANNRIETTLQLEIDGGTMTFANGDTTGTVTTSASATSNVGIAITGAGFSNIITKVQV